MIFTILCIGVDVQFTLVKSKEGVMYLIQQRLYWLFEIAPLWFSFQLQYIGVSQPPLVTGWKIPRISSPSGAPPLGGHNPPFNAQSRERAKEPLCWCHCCTACYGTPSMPRMIKKSISASQLSIFCTRTPSIVLQHRGHLQLQTRVVQTADSAVWQSRRGVEIAICRLAHCHHFRTTHVHVCFDILASISYIS